MTRPLARAAVLVATLIALTAPTAAPARQTGANTTPYPEQFKTNFMKGCMEGARPSPSAAASWMRWSGP